MDGNFTVRTAYYLIREMRNRGSHFSQVDQTDQGRHLRKDELYGIWKLDGPGKIITFSLEIS